MNRTLVMRASAQTAFRISPDDTNYFVILFDPRVEDFAHVCVIEIFEVGGKTPPNAHRAASEFFFVMHGQGTCHFDGSLIALGKGDALLLRPGVSHVIENVGATKLYTLTVMFPDEEFSALIRSGTPVPLDAEDRDVIAGHFGLMGDDQRREHP